MDGFFSAVVELSTVLFASVANADEVIEDSIAKEIKLSFGYDFISQRLLQKNLVIEEKEKR